MTFKDELDGDLVNVFFNGEDFAEVAVYRPANGEPYEVNVIFDRSSENAEPQGAGYARVQSHHIRCRVREADIIGGVFREDQLTAREVDYHIVDKESDGLGVLLLILQRQQ